MLEVPHAGYHWDGVSPRFFEGWYFRVMIPHLGNGFAFMYSIQDPIGSEVNSGGTVQIIDGEGDYFYRTLPDTTKFNADRRGLNIQHWRKNNLNISPRYLHPADFDRSIGEGYQATANLQQGRFRDPKTGELFQWYYEIENLYTWGDPSRNPRATAGLLSYLPIFDPGWQILTAHGLATGYIDFRGKKYEFQGVPFYSEKNWGYSFPDKWFWINCNSFDNHPDLTLTAVGSTRKVLQFTESVGMVGIHYGGRFYKFDIWNCRLKWSVSTWGYWKMTAENEDYSLYLIGTSDNPPSKVRVPTERGMDFRCLDTLKGNLEVGLQDCRGRKIIEARSGLAGLEIGGIWVDYWEKID